MHFLINQYIEICLSEHCTGNSHVLRVSEIKKKFQSRLCKTLYCVIFNVWLRKIKRVDMKTIGNQ